MTVLYKLAAFVAIAALLSSCALSDRKARVVTNLMDKHIQPKSSWSRAALAAPSTVSGNLTLAIDGAVLNPVIMIPGAVINTAMQEFYIAESITQTEAGIYIYLGSLVFYPPLLVCNWIDGILLPMEHEPGYIPPPTLSTLFDEQCIKPLPRNQTLRVSLSPLLVIGAVSCIIVDELITAPFMAVNEAAHSPQKLWTDLDWRKKFVYSCATVPWRLVATPVLYGIHAMQPSTYRTKEPSTTPTDHP